VYGTPVRGLPARPGICGVKARGFGPGRGTFGRRAPEPLQRDRGGGWLRDRRLVDAQNPARRFRIMTDTARGTRLRPIHRPDIKLGMTIEPFETVGGEARPLLNGHGRL